MNIPERYRLPLAVVTSLIVVVIVAGAVLLLNRPAPQPVVSPSPTAVVSPSLDLTTPEGAVRAFFEAYAQAGKTDDPSIVTPFVTGKDSSAYLSVAAFLKGQKQSGKASVTTVLRLENVQVQQSGSTATVSFDYIEGGYNIDPKTGQPLETPVVLPTAKVAAVVRQVSGKWLSTRTSHDECAARSDGTESRARRVVRPGIDCAGVRPEGQCVRREVDV